MKPFNRFLFACASLSVAAVSSLALARGADQATPMDQTHAVGSVVWAADYDADGKANASGDAVVLGSKLRSVAKAKRWGKVGGREASRGVCKS